MTAPAPSGKPPLVVPGVTRREVIIGVAAAVAVLALVIFGIMRMSSQVAGSTMRGTIIDKEFKPQLETQIIVGRQGAQRREIKGEYILKVRVPAEEDRVFNVWVDEPTFQRHKIGAPYSFQRPPPKPVMK